MRRTAYATGIDALGWSAEMVTRHKNIKTNLCDAALSIAKLTRGNDFVNADENCLVNSKLTIVNFAESHIRAFLKELPYDCSNPDRNIMRAQVAAITELIEDARNPKRNGEGSKALTAKVAGTVARKRASFQSTIVDLQSTRVFGPSSTMLKFSVD